MRRRRAGSEAMLFSLSEFAFLFFFLAVAGVTVLYGRQQELDRVIRRQDERIRVLDEEVVFLNELLEEVRYGVVPCWRRPERAVPPVVGVLTLRGEAAFDLAYPGSGVLRSEETLEARHLGVVFAWEFAYARDNNCYLRLEVRNETDSFELYREAAATIRSTGMVVVNG